MDEYLKKQEEETGEELTIKSDETENGASENGAVSKILITEFHEVRTINSGLKDLAELGFNVESLMSEERTGIEDARFVLRRGETATDLNDLRGLPAAIRTAGEKGMSITRFKGLGEMNAEELRETTLDPENRTLIQVKMTNAADADDMFRILMGDKVEPRREFIEKHALEVKNLDV
jgi:DNA gyrase subunit B